MRKRIIAFFIVIVCMFTFIGSVVFYKLNVGDLILTYPSMIIETVSTAPDGKQYNLRTIGDELAYDLSTVFVLGGVRTANLLLNDGNHQLKRSECKSTLDKAIYMVQAMIRKAQNSYPDPIYDVAATQFRITTVSLCYLPNVYSNATAFNLYNLTSNILNVSFTADEWKNTFGYHITRNDTFEYFAIEIFDGDPSNIITEQGLEKRIYFYTFGRGSDSWKDRAYYIPIASEQIGNFMFEVEREGNIDTINVGVDTKLITYRGSTEVEWFPYGEIDEYFIAF